MIVFYLIVVYVIVILNVLLPNVFFRREIDAQIVKSQSEEFCHDNNLFRLKQTNRRLELYRIVRKDGTSSCKPYNKDKVELVRCTGSSYYQSNDPCATVLLNLLMTRDQ